MEMLNKAFEDADAYKKMMEKLTEMPADPATLGPSPTGNRAQRRAYAKLQRRKGNKVRA